MEIFHHIGFGHMDQMTGKLDSLGVQYERRPLLSETSFVAYFDISESDPKWPEVSRLIADKHVVDIAWTVFSPHEVLAADWLRINVRFEQGYPQPRAQYRWKDMTLDRASACRSCGVGATQSGSFRIAKDPHLGKKDFMSLYWTGAVFATPRVFDAFEKAGLKGYERRPVLIHRTGIASKAVSQIYAPGQTNGGLVLSPDNTTETCDVCGLVKPNRIRRGRMQYRVGAFPRGRDFVRTSEWFGSAAFAFQEVLVSSRAARVFLEQKWQGVSLEPLELV